MSILITGGAGYIGSHTCVELLAAGYELVVADSYVNSKPEALRRVKELAGTDFPCYNCDIRNREGLRQIFAAHPVEAVIHFAGLKSVPESVRQPLQYFNNNIGGTVTLLETMAETGCETIVFSSSATVYSMNNPSPMNESMPVGGVTNPYGRTKLIIEEMLRDVCAADPDFSAALLRYFNPVGAHESGRIGEDPQGIPNNLMPFVTQVAVGKLPVLTVTGTDYDTPDGTCVRDYIHVVDLAKGHVKALAYALGHKGAEAVNLGTGKGHSVREVVRAFEAASGVRVPTVNGPRRPGDIAVSCADPSKARTLLRWQAEKTLEDMCRDVWRWQSGNPDGYEFD